MIKFDTVRSSEHWFVKVKSNYQIAKSYMNKETEAVDNATHDIGITELLAYSLQDFNMEWKRKKKKEKERKKEKEKKRNGSKNID
jgi:hypothetical protein